MLIKVLLNLVIATIFMPLVTKSLLLLTNIKYLHQEIADLIAIRQLQQIFLVAYEREIIANELLFRYQGKEFCLKQHNDKLLLTPGSQCYFVQAKKFKWLIKKGYIYLRWQRGNDIYEAPITKEEGLSHK